MTDQSIVALGFDTSILAGSVSASSRKMYERDFRSYLNYAVTPEMAVQSLTFARWRSHLANNTELSPNTINRMMSAVKKMMKEAESQGYVPRGTHEDFKRIDGVRVVAMKERKKEHARTYISPETMRMLTSLPDTLTLVGMRDRALLHTLASSGLRVNELATLKVYRVFYADKGYHARIMGKNDVEFRDAPLSKEAYEAIQEWLHVRTVDSEYIFTRFEGHGTDRLSAEHLSNVSLWRIVRAYAAELGLEHIKVHDFRRFVGTQLAKKNPHAAQKALGHKDISTTFNNYVLSDLEAGITDDLY
jgi:integrase/recombinase XerD